VVYFVCVTNTTVFELRDALDWEGVELLDCEESVVFEVLPLVGRCNVGIAAEGSGLGGDELTSTTDALCNVFEFERGGDDGSSVVVVADFELGVFKVEPTPVDTFSVSLPLGE
jgi:hypothetical protein